MIRARSICGAALDVGMTGEQGFRDDMWRIDHGIMEDWCSGGSLRSNVAVCMDDDCIGHCWREKVPVVGWYSFRSGESLGTSLLCRNANGGLKTAQLTPTRKKALSRPDGCIMQTINNSLLGFRDKSYCHGPNTINSRGC